MKMRRILLGLVFIICADSAFSETSDIPKIVSEGIEILKNDGPAKALPFWFAGSPVNNGAASLAGQIGSLNAIGVSYGKVVGYEYLGTIQFTKSVKRYYIVILYTKGPLYSWFEVYSFDGKEIVTSFDSNTKAAGILPYSFFDMKK